MPTSETLSQGLTIHRNGHVHYFDDDALQEIAGIPNGRSLDRAGDAGRRANIFHNLKRLSQTKRRSATKHLPPLGGDATRANGGLVPVQAQLARHNGATLKIFGSSTIRQLSKPVNIESLRYPSLAEFIQTHERGHIAIPKGGSRTDVIHDICAAYPDANIVVLGMHAGQLKRICSALRQANIDAVAIWGKEPLQTSDDEDFQEPRVILATPLGIADAEFSHKDIAILLDGFQCDQSQMERCLMQIDAKFRLFGLVDAERRPAPSEADSLFVTFGPARLELNENRQVRRDARVTWINTPPPRNSLEPTDAKFAPQTYWHQEHRNRRIWQLATALTSGEPLDRRQCGQLAEISELLNRQPVFVAVLVERPLHAVALSQMLPDWPIIISDEAMQELPGSFRHRVQRSRSEWRTDPSSIVVAGSAASFCADSIDVIVWAGGGQSTGAIPRRWLFAESGCEKPLLIVDFQDQHNPHAERFSRQRKREYAERFISPLHQTQEQAQIDQFIRRLEQTPCRETA